MKFTSKQSEREMEPIWLGVMVVGGLSLLFGVVNWLWLQANVVTYGWDRMDHLITSLSYYNVFQAISPYSLFQAIAWSDYYPPLVHFVIVMGYKVFGVSEDVAAIMNLIYLVLLLSSVWYIGRRVGGSRVAALATLVVGTFPMIYIMSRYLYLDFALTCLVATSIALLLASERFTRRLPSLLFGVALGASFWVKWTAAAFLAAPLALIVWRSGVLAYLVRHPAAWRPNRTRLLLALLTGFGSMALWLFFARELVTLQPLGWWLWLGLGLPASAMLYALMTPVNKQDTKRQIVANVLSAGTIGAFLLSLWYVINLEFIQGFFSTAYGREGGRFFAYEKYLNEVVAEQMGPFYSAIFLFVVLGFAWNAIFRRPAPLGAHPSPNTPHAGGRWGGAGGRGGRHARGGRDTALVLLLWAMVPYLIFSTRVSLAHSRFLMPFLPPFAIWIALGLWRLRPTGLRTTAIGLVMFLAWAQFGLMSFDSLAIQTWRERLVIDLPSGAVNLLPHGFFIQYPSSIRTDPGFAIAPEILSQLEEGRQQAGSEHARLGLIVNSAPLHEKHLLYQIYIKFNNIILQQLSRNRSDRPAYGQLFEMDYVLVSDTHSYRTFEESQGIAKRILSNPDDAFNRAFREIGHWRLPNDENIYLYERRFPDTEPGIVAESYQKLIEQFGSEFGEGDALILTAPDQIYIMGLALPDTSQASVLPLPSDGASSQETIATLEQAAQEHERLFLLSHNSSAVDAEGEIENWLRTHTISGAETWVDALRVSIFIPPTTSNRTDNPLNITFGGTGPTLQRITFDTGPLQPAQALTNQTSQLKVSLQLIAPNGTLIAQHDTDLTNDTQQQALLIPRAITPDSYRLVLKVYDSQSLEQLALPDGQQQLELGNVIVR